MHDVEDHTAGCRAAFGSRVDADGLFCSPGILFTVDINPEKGLKGSNKAVVTKLCSKHYTVLLHCATLIICLTLDITLVLYLYSI